MATAAGISALDGFSPATRDWFARAFAAPTAAQEQAWPAIASGEHVLLSAPTGSGKTLAAFLWGIDRLASESERPPGRRIDSHPPAPSHHEAARGISLLYVSPLKALSYDIDRNLRVPLRGIGADLSVAVRSGDTPQRERQEMLRNPPDILITAESLYLMLTGQAQKLFEGTRWCIVDEIHAVASTKRGAHLALTLERLAEVAQRGGGPEPQRIGLSATQNPLEEVARFMVGPSRQRRIVDAGVRKQLDLKIQVPVESMAAPGKTPGAELDPLAGGTEPTINSIWPAMYPELLGLVREHNSTIIFVNARRSAERLALRLNELSAAEDEGAGRPVREIARAHHGSLAREERTVVEELLKAGELPCLVATSSLELGIDMGAVDLVIQVESPKSVARGLQRSGHAGHNVGDISRGRIFPKFRADLLECAVVARRMRNGEIETTVVPRNPLDVLAQQIVSITAAAETRGTAWDDAAVVGVDELYALVTRTHTYAELTRTSFENVLDMLDGRYPSSGRQKLGRHRDPISYSGSAWIRSPPPPTMAAAFASSPCMCSRPERRRAFRASACALRPRLRCHDRDLRTRRNPLRRRPPRPSARPPCPQLRSGSIIGVASRRRPPLRTRRWSKSRERYRPIMPAMDLKPAQPALLARHGRSGKGPRRIQPGGYLP